MSQSSTSRLCVSLNDGTRTLGVERQDESFIARKGLVTNEIEQRVSSDGVRRDVGGSVDSTRHNGVGLKVGHRNILDG